MAERDKFTPPETNRSAVIAYYDAAKEGYWNYLKGRCHYGFTPEGSKGRFDMERAQIDMEIKVGETLDLPPGSRILDAGCGYSPVARTLTEKFGYDVTGIDLIRERLHVGNQVNSDLGISDIDLANADYHNLPFADNTFDGVYTMETLVHAYDHKRVLGEFKRVLKPGGKLALFEYTIPPLDTVPNKGIRIRDLAERVIENTGMTSLPHFTHGSFPKTLEEAGFQNAEAVDVSKNVYPSWYYLWKFAARQTFDNLRRGQLTLDKIPGSFYIWPARHKLGYVISKANKPSV